MFSRKHFIVGLGRSGTHWLSRILVDSGQFHVTMEQEPMISIARVISKDPRREDAQIQYLFEAWEKEHNQARPKHYADKSQHVIWFTTPILERFPEAKFIGIQRNSVLAFVSSAIKHGGIPFTMQEYTRFPIPSRYFGILNKEEHEKLHVEEKLTRMWLSHKYKMIQLKKRLGSKIHVVRYERLIKEPENEINLLREFLELDNLEIKEERKPNPDCINKWEKHLSKIQMERVTRQIYDRMLLQQFEELVEQYWR